MNVSLPKGTRDFGPAQMAKRQFILNNIRSVFQKYGFMPLETPAMENLSTLTGKYGDEGDQLLFRILKSGDFTKTINDAIKGAKLFDDKLRYAFNSLFLIKFNEARGIESGLSGPPYKLVQEENISQLATRIFTENSETVNNFINEELKNPHFISAYKASNTLFDSLLQLYSRAIDEALDPKSLVKDISEKGLRYDLTVPFARYVVMNRNEVTLPFKRYQIQPVWRADRPQKGRYREFYQCDADVVGTDSLINEAEIVLMIQEAFGSLGIKDFTIKINHRGVLSGLAEIAGAKGNEGSLFVAIDKLEKIGPEKVKEELKEKGYPGASIDQVFEILAFKGTNQQKLELLKNRFVNSETGKKGIDDLKKVFGTLNGFGLRVAGFGNSELETRNSKLELDISLARGLSYYTGTIFEVKVNNVSIGSVSGGGRYDNLTQAFGAKEKLSGVGISFGIDRIYDVMEELNLFPNSTAQFTKVLIVHMDEATMNYGLGIAHQLRHNGISTEIYPDISKMKKQLDYANKKQIPFAVIIGSEEIAANEVTLKDLNSGEQTRLKLENLIAKLR